MKLNVRKILVSIFTTLFIIGSSNYGFAAQANIVSSVQTLKVPCDRGNMSFDRTTLVCYNKADINDFGQPVTLLDLSTFKVISAFKNRDVLQRYQSSIISPDNTNIFLNSSKEGFIWDTSTGAKKEIKIRVSAIHPDGKTVYYFDRDAVYSSDANNIETGVNVPNILFKWSEVNKSYRENELYLNHLIITHDGKFLIDRDNSIIFNLQKEKLISRLEANIIDISDDSRIIAGAYVNSWGGDSLLRDKTIKLWNVSTGKLIKSIVLTATEKYSKQQSSKISSLAISPNNKLIAYTFEPDIGESSNLGIIDLSSGKLLFKSYPFPNSRSQHFLPSLTIRGFTKDSKKLIMGSKEEIKIITLK
ncbi:hypothetical protein FJR11_20715 [Anabaena sp. UHCC 0187]|uniref:WD40 repeat domain-containing protein n=1 Tax=Anabaena sp. UHCC 0187 TaxID=2590018 RepID=UPI001446D78E|nr:hypothetical protein [Anabaena sp. UHCC 0187]MTJ14955.1 hypothetical protein [Anabaena sp. UHCC 0187]